MDSKLESKVRGYKQISGAHNPDTPNQSGAEPGFKLGGAKRSLNVAKNYIVSSLDLDVGLKIVEFDVGLKKL